MSEPRETHPRSEIADVPTSPCPPYDNLGCPDPHPRLNYVASYTGPLLFLFERTHNYYVDNQGLVPWRLRRLGKSKVRSASLVKVLSDGRISWDSRSQSSVSWNPPPPTTQSNTCLLKKKTEGEGVSAPKRVRTHQRDFHISTTEMILKRPMGLLIPHQSRTTWVLLASIWRVLTRLGVLGFGQGYYEFRLLWECCTWLGVAVGGRTQECRECVCLSRSTSKNNFIALTALN